MSWPAEPTTPSSIAGTDTSALAGIRVLDLTSEWGSYCTKLLADMGADVVKVEPPTGDPARQTGPFVHDERSPTRSLHFMHFNTGKRSVTLDLSRPNDRAILLQLAAAADLFIEDFAPGYLADLGVGYEVLRARNPELVVTSITPFGQTGPYAPFHGNDLIALAMGGLLNITGDPTAPPVRPHGGQSHHVASLYAAVASLAALRLARAGEGGQHIDVSAQACTVTCSRLTGNYLATGDVPQRRGARDFFVYPADVFSCSDGDVLIITPAQDQWLRLVAWMASEDAAGDLTAERFEAPLYRRDHFEEVRAVIAEWTRTHTVREIFEGGQARHLPFGAVSTMADFARNAHLQARGFFVPVEHEELEATFTYPGPPYLFGRTPWRTRRAPLLGEHNHRLPSPPASDGQTSSDAAGVPRREGRLPLEGVRVVDFTWVWAGPYATRVLADLGAEVIKVERKDARAQAEARAGAFGRRGVAPSANALNRNKHSITVDWKDPRGMNLVHELVRRSDIVIENFSAGTMTRVGLGYEDLSKIRPDIIAISMSGFGQTGPWSSYVSYGPTLQALAGLIELTGYPDAPGVGVGEAYPDVQGGLKGALAAVIALQHRDRTGEGQFIDVAQLQTAADVLGSALLEYTVNGRSPTRQGNRLLEPPAAPHGVYPCQGEDRWCAIAVSTDEQWRALLEVLAQPEWAADTRFATVSGRMEHQEELDELIGDWTRERLPHDVMELLQGVGVPAAAVQDTRDLVEYDAQLRHRGFWCSAAYPDTEPFQFEGVPVLFSRTPLRIRRLAPMPGDDTDYVLRNVLQLPDDVARDYAACGVV